MKPNRLIIVFVFRIVVTFEMHHFCSERFAAPLEISEFSPTPPQSDSVTSGRSQAESDKHSVPLSAAALPTDWGDWDPEHLPASTQCLGTCSDSLKTDRETPTIIFSTSEVLF